MSHDRRNDRPANAPASAVAYHDVRKGVWYVPLPEHEKLLATLRAIAKAGKDYAWSAELAQAALDSASKC